MPPALLYLTPETPPPDAIYRLRSFGLTSSDARGNMLFKASDKKSTPGGNSRMFARLLCPVVRTIEQGHKWLEEYPFDRKQVAAAKELREAIDVEEVNDNTVKEAIHGLGPALFLQKAEAYRERHAPYIGFWLVLFC